MNDLIINGIDHSVFDLEWAKRGGVVKVYSLIYKQPNTIHQYKEMDYFGMAKFIDDETDGTVNVYMLNKRTSVNKNTTFLAMATPAECAEAGVEYIEPPMMWRDIESAPKNQLILLLQHTLSYGDCIYSGAYVDGEWLDYTGKVHNSPHLWMPLPQPQKDE